MVETFRLRPEIDGNRGVPVCGRRPGHFWHGFVRFWGPFGSQIGDFRPDPYKFSGRSAELSAAAGRIKKAWACQTLGPTPQQLSGSEIISAELLARSGGLGL